MTPSHPRRFKSALSAAVAIALCPVSAMALEPGLTPQIQSVTISDLYGRVDTENTRTLLVGIDGCERAMRTGGTITVTFQGAMNFDLSTDVNNGLLNTPYFNGVYTFDTETNSGSSPNCLSNNACNNPLSDSRINRTMADARVEVPFAGLVSGSVNSAQDCATSELERDYFVRLQLTDSVGVNLSADAKISLDLSRPEPPESFDAIVTQGAIDLQWEAGPSGDVETYMVVYSSEEFAGEVLPAELKGVSRISVLNNANGAASTSLTRDLKAKSTVWLAVASVDEVGNPSALTASKPFEVIDTVDFWEYYTANGGGDRGGYCSSAPSGQGGAAPSWPLGALALLGALRAARRRPTTHRDEMSRGKR